MIKHWYASAQKAEAKLLGKVLKRNKKWQRTGVILSNPIVLQAVYDMYLNKPVIAWTKSQKLEKIFWEQRFWDVYCKCYYASIQ